MNRLHRTAGVPSARAVLAAVLALAVLHFSFAAAPSASAVTMEAVVYHQYGAADVLHLEALPKPTPADDSVLVRVHAASVNPYDWHFMRGTPYIVRMMVGLRRPKSPRLGVDFAGTVVGVGKHVAAFKPGDEVFGGHDGAFAQYVTVREHGSIALMPQRATFEQAAAVPIAGVTALQALRDVGHLRAGERVLINGASGGVGTFAVQIAKAFGAEVTAVCSTRNAALVRSIGADHVIDYTREDFTREPTRYDLVLDTVGNHGVLDYRRVLKPRGIAVMIGGGGARAREWIGPVFNMIELPVVSWFTSQKFVTFEASLEQRDLEYLANLIQLGKLTPVIDRRYPLAATAAAITYLENGHARGKVVIDVQ
ncbi:MAG TPA: NAD(P)-dependent alcohol dehydrogenase [Steroidobacteraceae bacterium]|nr:NAD(P)-dependent alcohol dehydrogenase [Steroidobacteraceae bacterium]